MKQIRYMQILATALIFTASSAHAQRDSDFYASAVAGIGFLGSEDLTYRDDLSTSTAEGDFEASIAAGGTVGYYVNEQWRIEGELMYRRNELEPVTIDGIGAATEGDFASLSAVVSALYDFKPFGNDRLTAYVGAGIAFVQEIDIDFEIEGVETSFESDELGLQLQFGARYDINESLFIDAGVRYLTLSGAEMEFPSDTSRVVEADYSPFTISAGLGWRF
ncbi:MAG: OmpW family protein [Gammaproteobacteria bacterium]